MNLKELRESRKLSRMQVMLQVGLWPNRLCEYENGKHRPRPATVAKLAACYRVSQAAIRDCIEATLRERKP